MRRTWEWLMERPGKPRAPARRIANVVLGAWVVLLGTVAFTPFGAVFNHWVTRDQYVISDVLRTATFAVAAFLVLWLAARFAVARHRKAAR